MLGDAGFCRETPPAILNGFEARRRVRAKSEEIARVPAGAGVMIAILAGGMSALLIIVLYPMLKRYALAEPNARSSHRTPTPQGGGIAVVAATMAATGVAIGLRPFGGSADMSLAAILLAALAMAGIGMTGDTALRRVAPRLLLQAVIIAGLVYSLPDHFRVFAPLPWWLERLLVVLGGLWFVNLVNFMDGLDWMTVAEVIPMAATVAALGLAHAAPAAGAVVALALVGAVIGFAYFNRPVAKLFLGDVGSLPIGLFLGWLLLLVAAEGHLAAAIVMPLYYLADASITVLRRLIRGEPVWEAHRTHFYQIATDRGFSVMEIVGRVFVVNVSLCALAVVSIILPGEGSAVAALLCGAILVAWLLFALAAGKKAAWFKRPRL